MDRQLDWKWRLTDQGAWLTRWLVGCETVLDLGCGPCSPVIGACAARLYGVDGHAPSAQRARESGAYENVACQELTSFLEATPDRHFSAVVALDVVEHFPKAEGRRLLTEMERVSRGVVIVATPNGFLRQDPTDNPHQEHLSGWRPVEFQRRGYVVKGLYGLKFLRGEGHEIAFRDFGVVMRLSHATSPVAARLPRLAAGLICMKLVADDVSN